MADGDLREMGAASPLLVIVWIYIAHGAFNTLLLSPWNPWRCMFWNRHECTEHEAWICNWLSFSLLHVTVLLACMSTPTSGKKSIEKPLAILCCAITIVQFAQGVFSLELLHRPLSVVQCAVYSFIVGAVLFLTTRREQESSNVTQQSATGDKAGSVDPGKKITITDAAMMLELLSSAFRYFDLVIGSGKESYLGDMSSPVYQNMSSLAINNVGLVFVLLAFALRFCDTDQRKNVLYGQALVLFASQLMMANAQGAKMNHVMAREGVMGTFVFIVIAFAGAF